MAKLSIIISTRNVEQLVVDCLRSLRRFPPTCVYEVLVVDNASTDGTVTAIKSEFPEVVILLNETDMGFAAANNRGMREARGECVLLLNSDTKLTAGAFDALVGFLDDREDVAAAAPKLLNNDGSLQRSWYQFPSPGKTILHILGVREFLLRILHSTLVKSFSRFLPGLAFYTRELDQQTPRRADYVLFACIVLRRSALEKVGLLDEGLFFYHEDCEYGYRLFKAGLQIWWVPNSKVIHLGGGFSRSAAEESYRHYFESLLHVFSKHESALTALALRGTIFLGFALRAALTPLGFYRGLEIPSTYASRREGAKQDFGSAIDRFRYYTSIAALAWRH